MPGLLNTNEIKITYHRLKLTMNSVLQIQKYCLFGWDFPMFINMQDFIVAGHKGLLHACISSTRVLPKFKVVLNVVDVQSINQSINRSLVA